MPYKIRRKKCKQSDGDSGNYTISYTDKNGKKHKKCHTSKEKMQKQIAAIESSKEADKELSERKGVYRPERGRYTITRKRCQQKRSGKSGSHVMAFTDHNGKVRSACHTSPKSAKRQISKIEKWLKNIVKKESLRRFVRKCLVEAEQNMYSVGLQDKQQRKQSKLDDLRL